jgi:hypothetical protein
VYCTNLQLDFVWFVLYGLIQLVWITVALVVTTDVFRSPHAPCWKGATTHALMPSLFRSAGVCRLGYSCPTVGLSETAKLLSVV